MNKFRFIAFYLPQYYPTASNNRWYGTGFTEWTNLGKARKCYPGHDFPHVPSELGYYDLRLPEVREAQAALAREYGIEGFCYYHYWFGNGVRELERPFQEVLASGKPDFPFCLCWANQTWKKKMWDKDAVIEALAAATDRLIVVNISGNAVAMPWAREVPSILQGWYIGSEAGHAIADVLSGDVNPSGKLPFTFPAKLEDVPAHSLGEYTGVSRQDTVDIRYNDGIYVGYRWTDLQKKTKPLFAFGHGLSYTEFEYGKPVLDSEEMNQDGTVTVSVEVSNVGEREGQEVVQLYVGDRKSSLPRPLKELKGFSKISLAPGESRVVDFTVDRDDLSFFDPEKHEWVAEPGVFDIYIGAASDDIRGKVSFRLK